MITITFNIEHDHTDELLGTHTKRFNSLEAAIDYMYESYKPGVCTTLGLPKDSGLYSHELDEYISEVWPIKRKYMFLLQTDEDVPDDAVIDTIKLI